MHFLPKITKNSKGVFEKRQNNVSFAICPSPTKCSENVCKKMTKFRKEAIKFNCLGVSK